MNFTVTISMDYARFDELYLLQLALRKHQPEPDASFVMLGEIFALGMQAAWLRLSKGEPIGPAPKTMHQAGTLDAAAQAIINIWDSRHA